MEPAEVKFNGERPRRVNSLAVIGAAVVIAVIGWWVLHHGIATSARLPGLGSVPAFSLTGSDGAPVSAADLRGHIWVADFIFTQCPSVCPTLSAQMAKLQQLLPRDAGDLLRLVSFSVDPNNDSPEVLRAYAQRFHADPQRWLFLTGKHDALYGLIRDGFHLAVAERSPEEARDGQGLITHSDRFVLVDRDLQIRAYYHGTDAEVVEQVLGGIAALRAES
jgi:protein SCO1/2